MTEIPTEVLTLSTLERLMEEQNPLFVVLEQMHDGVLIGDNTQGIIWFNEALEEHLDLPQSALSSTCQKVFNSIELSEQIDSVIQSRTNVSCEISIKCNNLLKVFQVHIMPLKETTPLHTSSPLHLSGFVALFHDLTEVRRTEKMRRDFVANVSHELRTPLTAIRGYAETLLDGALGDQNVSENFVQIIYNHSHRLSQLVADLLDLSKLEAPDFKPELRPLELAPVIRRAVSLVQANIEGKELTLNLELPESIPAVMGDSSNLEQVFTNLLDNAVKYTPEKGQVTLTVEEQPDNFILIKISDTGMGIEPKHIPRLFERFYRVDKARSRDLGGTGLGLSIVKHIIQYHGGDIWVGSVVNEGTTFSLTFPRA